MDGRPRVLAFAVEDVSRAWEALDGADVPFPPFRLEKAAGLAPEDARRSLVSWALLRFALLRASATGKFSEHATPGCIARLGGADVEIEVAASGKPRFKEAGWLDFSLSHSGEAVMCAVSDAPVGCDVEQCARFEARRAGFEKRVLHQREKSALSGLPCGSRPLASCAVWTLKEAFGKRCGTGLSYDTASFDFSAPALGMLQPGQDGARFSAHGAHFRAVERGGAVFACCSGSPSADVAFVDAVELAGAVSTRHGFFAQG